jgi:hypothetical protein
MIYCCGRHTLPRARRFTIVPAGDRECQMEYFGSEKHFLEFLQNRGGTTIIETLPIFGNSKIFWV